MTDPVRHAAADKGCQRLAIQDDPVGGRSARSQCRAVMYKSAWSENRTSAGRAAAAGGAERRRLLLGLGGLAGFADRQFAGIRVRAEGFDGDLVAEAFQAPDMVAGTAADVRFAFV